MIRLLCIEDHALIVEGLHRRFRPSRDGLQIVLTFTNVPEAINSADPDSFDLILLDLWLPGSQPVENVKRLQQCYPAKPIVILTMEDTAFWKKQMFEAGVSAYLTKEVDKADLKRTLLRVNGGEIIHPTLMDSEQPETVPAPLQHHVYYLKPSQKEIIKLFSQGVRIKEISRIKNTTPTAIEKTLRTIRKQFNVRTNAEVIRILASLKEI